MFCTFRLRQIPFLLSIVYGAHVAQAQEAADAPSLSTVSVTAVTADGFVPETVEAGSFRGSNIMDVPSTVNVVTREVLELQGADGVYDALRNTAGVTRQQNGGETWDQLVIRGIGVENRTNYRLNGSMPVLNFSQIPMENKERVEVLKGASALYYGFTTPSGVVNFVTKRAGAQPVTTVGMEIDQYGTALATMDIGRRFGDEQQYGLRINAAGGSLGSYLNGVDDGERSFVSAAFDWRVNSRLTLKVDVDYDHRKITEQVGVKLPNPVNGVITLPHPVDPRQLVGPDWSNFETDIRNVQLRADYVIDDNWLLTLEAGQSQANRDRQLPTFTLTNAATGSGSISGNIQSLEATTDMLRAELFGSFNVAGFQNNLTLGATRTRYNQDPIYQRNYSIASQNLYNPIPITTVTLGAVPTTASTLGLATVDTGVYALDQVTLSSQWLAMFGLRHSNYKSDQGTNHYNDGKTTPMASLVYKITPSLSAYTSFAQGLEQGETAPDATANKGERLAPGVSRQKEVGMRWGTSTGMLVSAALFDIQQPGYYTDASKIYTVDGKKNYRGLELSAQGQFTKQLAWQASTQWLDAEFSDINATYNGKSPENTAKRTGSVFLSYALTSVPGLSINGGAYYTGPRPVNDLDQAYLGGVTIYSIGSRYITRMWGHQTTWQFNMDNVADKEYWAAGGSRLAAGAPRTAKLIFKLDL